VGAGASFPRPEYAQRLPYFQRLDKSIGRDYIPHGKEAKARFQSPSRALMTDAGRSSRAAREEAQEPGEAIAIFSYDLAESPTFT